jgi:hypothetical protein
LRNVDKKEKSAKFKTMQKCILALFWYFNFADFCFLLLVRNSCACLNDSEMKTLQILRAIADCAELELHFAPIGQGQTALLKSRTDFLYFNIKKCEASLALEGREGVTKL